MEYTDTDLFRNTTRPPSRTIAMGLPEILVNFFTFLDRPTLQAFLQVSRFWYTHGRAAIWQTLSLSIPRFVNIACNFRKDDEDYDNYDDDFIAENEKYKTNDDKLQGFINNCHRIRSLTLTSPENSKWLCPDLCDTLDSRVAELKNLTDLAIHQRQFYWNSYQTYHLTGAVLAQNTGIQSFYWHGFSRFYDEKFTDFVLKRMGRKLKKLSVSAIFNCSKLMFLDHVMKAHRKHQGHQPQQELEQQKLEQQKLEQQKLKQQKLEQQELEQQEGTTMNQDSLMDESFEDEVDSWSGDDSDDDNDDYNGFQLEELVLRDLSYYASERQCTDVSRLYDSLGELPIRALTFVNFVDEDNREQDEDNHEQVKGEPYSSILPVLNICPRLEKLRVSFDHYPDLPDSSPRGFLDKLRESFFFVDASNYKGRKESEEFVEEMYSCCPRLREIEFAMFYRLTSDHWIEMMETYGSQLESLSIWGNVTAFDSDAFMALIGSPISRPTRDGFHSLTRLNINGMEHLHNCACMALYLLPHLKEFMARDVPLDAKSLIDDDWICQGLEVLEICVAIPRRTRWQWGDTHGVWTKGNSEDEDEDEDRDGNDSDNDINNNSDQCGMEGTLKRRLVYLAIKGPRKKAREDLTEYNDTQVKVCEMLGRLTQLRQLRIEGRRHFMFCKRDWGCLELTLETGLSSLAPLRHNLERLIVSGLDEGLTGRKEVEWIARNWVHFNNQRWLEQHDPSMAPESTSSLQSMEEPQTSKTPGLRSDDDDRFIPYPSFKELIGVAMDDANASNVSWLQEQCPTLSVIKVCSE